MSNRPTIVLVLRTGGDFAYRDVELIAKHINGKWQSRIRPRIICLYDKVSTKYDLGNIELHPLTNAYPGTWSRIQLYSPEMEQYRPFLYIDLDTAVIQSLENIFAMVDDPSEFITLEDFWQKGQLATGLAWIPAKSEKVSKIWNLFKGNMGSRMDRYIRSVVTTDKYWQQLTDNTIYDFKPKTGTLLTHVPKYANIICFHGKPRIFTIVEGSITIDWVKEYVDATFTIKSVKSLVTVIIPYNRDRGYLKEAVESVPEGIQLILSKGEGNWPMNFNKGFAEAIGTYVKYLHEDDILTPNCIEDSVNAIEEQKVDFIHGNAIEVHQVTGKEHIYIPREQFPTVTSLLKRNVIHSATIMYHRRVFEKVGLFNEALELKSFEEFEFNLRCLRAGLKIGYCNTTLAYYRRHPEQIIRTVNNVERNKNRSELIHKFMS
jgi:hypothetical protein